MERWEYLTAFIKAETAPHHHQFEEYEEKAGEELAKYAPQKMMPELNKLGAKGWELVHVQPVITGKNEDVLLYAQHTRNWTFTYFCLFKRSV